MMTKKSNTASDFFRVSILLLAVLSFGIYLIVTTVIIAKDGVTFISYAKNLEHLPIKTIGKTAQHPGYPWLILMAHKLTDVFWAGTSIFRWICCGQGVSLIFRLLSIVALYFAGKRLVGATESFWAVLIFPLLPGPAEYGSDVLSDWPHLFFFVLCIFFLLKGTVNQNPWFFGIAGLSAGIGYLIRPECSQLVMAGSMWLVLHLVRFRHTMIRAKSLFGLALLLSGFLIAAGPYMKLKSAIFPKKNIGQLEQISLPQKDLPKENPSLNSKTNKQPFTVLNIAKAFGTLAKNIGETLMWFFVVPLIIGLRTHLRKGKWHEQGNLLVIMIVLLNTVIMVWLYCRYGYMSNRHTLPLIMILVLFVPAGLQELAFWLRDGFSGKVQACHVINQNTRRWFWALFLIGMLICMPKLLRPIRIDKQGYRLAAQWLEANTDSSDIVAVPDRRISFYAQRKGLIYNKGIIPPKAAYIVDLSQEGLEKSDATRIVYQFIAKKKDKSRITVYQNLRVKI
jgi:hypothetical protein